MAIHYHELVEALWADPRQVPMMKVPTPSLASGDYDAPRFEPLVEETEEVRNILKRLAKRDVNGPIVLLNPNAGDLLPIRRFAFDASVRTQPWSNAGETSQPRRELRLT